MTNKIRYSLLIRITLLLIFLLPLTLFAQSIKDVRINEIQVKNSEGLQDEYGRPVSWIELANRGYNKVNVAGCYLKVNGKEYKIPYNDPKTIIPTQGYLVFYAAGDPEKGALHTSFKLDNTDYISFYDMDGELIDSLAFNPSEMIDNVSYGWLQDSSAEERLTNLPATTPGATNNTIEKISRAELFRQADPSGLVLTITTIAVVTVALIVLSFLFVLMGKFNIRSMRQAEETTEIKTGKGTVKEKSEVITGEELAALAMALYEYSEELHDVEDMILTINHVAKAYSPWNSKIYGLTQMPNKK